MSRNGDDLGSRLPQIVEAMQSLAVKSCVIDGEAIVTNDKGLAVFDLIRGHRHHVGAELCASTCSSWTVRIYDAFGLRNASGRWQGYSVAFSPASWSTSISKVTARSSMRTRKGSGRRNP
jgi:hypothetical protein